MCIILACQNYFVINPRKKLKNNMKAFCKIMIAAGTAMLISGCDNIQTSPGQAYYKSFTYSGNDRYFDSAKLKPGEVFNPVLQGSYTDASICRKGDDYYMVTSNYTFFPGLPILHSKDLVNWEQICYALPTDQQLQNSSLLASQGLFAATIRYNEAEDKFYIASTMVGGGGHFVVKADKPEGPWSEPEWQFGLGGVHPSLFFDTNGRAYILNQGNPNYEPPYKDYKAIWIQELDPSTLKTKGERKIILGGGDILDNKPTWLEAPQLFKRGQYYILLASEGGGLGNGASTCAYRSENIWGPYEHYSQNPILTQRRLDPGREDAVSSTSHVDMVEAPDGKWFAVFQGIRPYNSNNDYIQGRETFVYPVTWDGDWPYIIRNGDPIASTIKAPLGVGYADDSGIYHKYVPHGNFTYVENFNNDTLPMQWEHLRTPSSSPIVPNGSNGLILTLGPNHLRSQRHANYIALRVMHNIFWSETEMHFCPGTSSEFAGLGMFLNDIFSCQYGVTLDDDEKTPILALQQAEEANEEIIKTNIASLPLDSEFKGRVFLRVEHSEDGFTFKYKFSHDSEYQTLVENVLTDYFSLTQAMQYKSNIISNSNVFFGLTIGPYASMEDNL